MFVCQGGDILQSSLLLSLVKAKDEIMATNKMKMMLEAKLQHLDCRPGPTYTQKLSRLTSQIEVHNGCICKSSRRMLFPLRKISILIISIQQIVFSTTPT